MPINRLTSVVCLAFKMTLVTFSPAPGLVYRPVAPRGTAAQAGSYDHLKQVLRHRGYEQTLPKKTNLNDAIC